MKVIPIVDKWQFTIGRKGSSGTRTYLSSTAPLIPYPPLSALEDLPAIFEPWSVDWQNVIVHSIDIEYVNGGCTSQYTVNYSSMPTSIYTVGNTANEYPKSIEINAEFTHYNDQLVIKNNAGFKNAGKEDFHNLGARDHWIWDSDKKVATYLPIRSYEIMGGFNITRDIYPTYLIDYLNIVMARVGRINNTTFLGIPEGLCLFLGADISEGTIYNTKKWNVKLNFSIRSNEGTWLKDEGWNQAFRPVKNKWESIVNDNGDKLYEKISFIELLNDYKTRPIFPGGI